MALITLKTNTGIGTATGYTGVETATNLWWSLRTWGSTITAPGGGGSLILGIGNGSDYKLALWIYQDGVNRLVQCIYRDAGGERYSEIGFATATITAGNPYVLSGYYHSSDAGKVNTFVYDGTNSLVAQAGEIQTEDTFVTTGYNIVTLPHSGANKVHDGLAFWNAAPGGNPNDEPTDVPSLLGYHAFNNNGTNEVSGAPAISFAGSSPTDWEYSAGGDWDSWGGDPPAGPSGYEFTYSSLIF